MNLINRIEEIKKSVALKHLFLNVENMTVFTALTSYYQDNYIINLLNDSIICLQENYEFYSNDDCIVFLINELEKKEYQIGSL